MEQQLMVMVDDYQAGACNIGPEEIARRRMTGHVGVVTTLALGGALAALGAPAWARGAVFLPAAVGAAGYIQAASRFCADYGWRGVFNFGEAGRGRALTVEEAAARAADRRKALQIGLSSGAIGALVAVGAVLLG